MMNYLKKVKILVAIALSGMLTSCGDECSKYSNYSCSQIEKASYNVYFYFPDGREQYLGEASGLQMCSAVARNYSERTKAPKNWICCMKTSKSQCEEKHR